MIDTIITYFNQFVDLDKEEVSYLVNNLPVAEFKKDAFLLKKGMISKNFFFIVSGCIRMFYEDGCVEKTAFFYEENDFVSAYKSFTKQTPSESNFQAIEDTFVICISHETAQDLLSKFPKFQFLARMAMEKELIIYQEIVSTFVNLNAEQRYKRLLERKPQLIQRIPLYHLATYIGVSAETLSRIRKRISEK